MLLIIASQLYLASLSVHWGWPLFLFVAWSYGGASSHALSLMTHELSHNLLFKTPILNSYFGIFCNVAMGLPSSTYAKILILIYLQIYFKIVHIFLLHPSFSSPLFCLPTCSMFKRYHMEHHQYQGDKDKDMDLPTSWEGRFFTNTPLKALWLLLQPAFYALRPTIVRPKKPMKLDILNTVTIVCTDALIVYYISPWALFYLILSTLLGMGFHPVAGHFISEHYVVSVVTS